MSKATTRVNLVSTNGEVVRTGVDAGEYDFIYSVATTKDPRYFIGDRVVLPDGREYRYAYSSAACISGQGCEFTYTGYTAITTFAVSAVAGARSITVPAQTHAALTVDELRNGYIIIFDGTTNNVQFRGIIGNAAADANAAFVAYLDGPLNEAVVASTSKCEVFKNPYAALRTATDAALAKAGISASKVSAASKYFWVQKGGFCWAAPQATVENNEGVGCMWRHDGSLEGVATAIGGTVPDADTTQYAGYRVTGSAAGNGPLFMLQG